MKKDLATLREQHQHLSQQLESHSSDQETIAALRAEIDQARRVHDQKIQEIAQARAVHDAKVAEIDAARQNMALLAGQIEDAQRAHSARDQIEADLRLEISRLRDLLQQRARTNIDPGLTPQTES